jgi:hypothetical protein
MALSNTFPLLDGIAPSWADIHVKAAIPGAALFEMGDIAAINTGTTLEIGEQRGASGGRIVRRTTGASSHEASVTFYRSGFQRILRNLKNAAEAAGHVRGNQVAVSLVHFGINVQFTPFGDVEIYEYRVKGCRLMSVTRNAAEGTDAQQIEVPLSVIEIVDMIDGKEVVLI